MTEGGGTTVTIVLPFYNEGNQALEAAEEIASTIPSKDTDIEVITVDDGSTESFGDEMETSEAPLRSVRLPQNRGKGAALRAGFDHARGQYVLFTDADLPYGTEGLERCLDILRSTSVDAAVGDRTMPRSSKVDAPPLHRRAFSKLLFSLNLGLTGRIADTQCGVKGFTQDAIKRVLPALSIDGFAIDVEVLHALLENGFEIRRFPVTLLNSEDSSVRPAIDGPRFALDLLRIHFRSLTGHYDVR